MLAQQGQVNAAAAEFMKELKYIAGEKPIDLASTKPSYQLADFKNEGNQEEPMIRKDFKDTAYWEPSAITGKDGRATVKFRLPDNLTTWRATAR